MPGADSFHMLKGSHPREAEIKILFEMGTRDLHVVQEWELLFSSLALHSSTWGIAEPVLWGGLAGQGQRLGTAEVVKLIKSKLA